MPCSLALTIAPVAISSLAHIKAVMEGFFFIKSSKSFVAAVLYKVTFIQTVFIKLNAISHKVNASITLSHGETHLTIPTSSEPTWVANLIKALQA